MKQVADLSLFNALAVANDAKAFTLEGGPKDKFEQNLENAQNAWVQSFINLSQRIRNFNNLWNTALPNKNTINLFKTHLSAIYNTCKELHTYSNNLQRGFGVTVSQIQATAAKLGNSPKNE